MTDQTNIEWCDSTFNPWMGCTKVSPACDHCYAENMMDTRLGRVEWGAGKPRRRTSKSNWNNPVKWNNNPFYVCDGCGQRGVKPVKFDDGSYRCADCSTETLREVRRRVFCASLADWLDNEVPIEWLVELLDLIRQTPNLHWLLLTKRIGNFAPRMQLAERLLLEQSAGIEDPDALMNWISDWYWDDHAPDNVWLGATVIDQAEADRDIPKLLSVPAAIRWVSVEPMLGPISLTHCAPYVLNNEEENPGYLNAFNALCRHPKTVRTERFTGSDAGIQWVVCGGESGSQARPMHPDWARSLRDQCQAAGAPFLFKQWGEWLPDDQFGYITEVTGEHWDTLPNRCLNIEGSECTSRGDDGILTGASVTRVGKKPAGRKLDGRVWSQFPEAGE